MSPSPTLASLVALFCLNFGVRVWVFMGEAWDSRAHAEDRSWYLLSFSISHLLASKDKVLTSWELNRCLDCLVSKAPGIFLSPRLSVNDGTSMQALELTQQARSPGLTLPKF